MVAAEVRAQRVERRLTQEEVSVITGIPVTTLSKIERGQTAIDVEQLALLARVFEMTFEQLVATARSVAASRRQPEEIYLADGALNPANTRGFAPAEEDIDELLSRRRNESNPG